MILTLTEQDVLDADFAKTLNAQAHVERCTPQELINEFANSRQEYNVDCARYERGVALLKDYIVLMSDRSVVDGRFDAKTAARVVSPIVQVESGHIATSVAYRAIALAQR